MITLVLVGIGIVAVTSVFLRRRRRSRQVDALSHLDVVRQIKAGK
jgi:LPXTG-motif cell wall-anchored protein